MNISYTECNRYQYICYKVGMFGVILTVKNAQMRHTPNLCGVWEFSMNSYISCTVGVFFICAFNLYLEI